MAKQADEIKTKFVKGNSFTYFTAVQQRKMAKSIARSGWTKADGSEGDIPEVVIPAEVLKAKAALASKLSKSELDSIILNVEPKKEIPVVDPVAPPVKAVAKSKKRPSRKSTPKRKS